MNQERLGKLVEVIEAERDHFDMVSWCFIPTPDQTVRRPDPWQRRKNRAGVLGADFDQVNAMPEELSCGTTFCIGGWATFLWPAEATASSIEDAAAQILDLTDAEAARLFDVDQSDGYALDRLRAWARDGHDDNVGEDDEW
jgi:hypothetical protein